MDRRFLGRGETALPARSQRPATSRVACDGRRQFPRGHALRPRRLGRARQGSGAGIEFRGVPVVGWDSLRYFWDARTPEAPARDLDRVSGITRSLAEIAGAPDRILPGCRRPAVHGEPPARRVAQAGRCSPLIAVSSEALFEFTISHWISAPTGGLPAARGRKRTYRTGSCASTARKNRTHCAASFTARAFVQSGCPGDITLTATTPPVGRGHPRSFA